MNQHKFAPMSKNPTCDTDAYKIPHWMAMKPGLTHQYTYGEPRIGGKYPFASYIGLTPVVQDHFLQPVNNAMIEEGRELSNLTFGTDKYFNLEGWKKVRDLGYMPMKIMSAPEGGLYPTNNALFTIESTKDWFAPMLNGATETMAMHVWYSTTVASRVYRIKERLKPLVEKSGTPELLPFMVNDFGARGATDWMADYRGGIGQLLHFEGSDNLIASRAVGHYYGFKGRAKSVYATEHSVALSFGLSHEEEVQYVLHQLEMCPKDLICAIVMDTKDLINFITNVIGDPRVVAKIKERTAPTVGRPDSGVPLESIERCLDIATSIFGFTINAKGYKVLNNNFRLIQGDGMNEESIISLYEAIVKNRWSTDNLFVGSGGGLLQVDLNRDTMRWAIKPSYGVFNHTEEKNFQKVVASQPDKASKPGRLILHPTGKNTYSTFSSAVCTPAMFGSYHNVMTPLYHDGDFNPPKFVDMIARASAAAEYAIAA